MKTGRSGSFLSEIELGRASFFICGPPATGFYGFGESRPWFYCQLIKRKMLWLERERFF